MIKQYNSLDIDKKIELYNQALLLRKQRKWSDVKIGKELGINHCIVNNWIYRGVTPSTTFNSPSLEPSPELAYIIGTSITDGYLQHTKYGRFVINLEAKDKDFVMEFNRCISKILNKKLYSIHKRHINHWEVEAYSKILYEFLSQPFLQHRATIEKFPQNFIRACFDAEGSICCYTQKRYKDYQRYSLTVSNTNEELIQYIKKMLERYIIGSKICSVKRKNYQPLWVLRVNRLDIPKFYKKIGFTIQRKQEKLESISVKLSCS